MKNPRCWARKLDDCSGTMSGEHRISVAAWPEAGSRKQKLKKHITFQKGWMRPGGILDTAEGFKREITLNGLTANVLCTTHNNALSELDVAAGNFSTAIRDFMATWREKRSIPGISYHPEVFSVDGSKLDRWLFKTVINNVIQNGPPVGSFQADAETPTDELVDIVFGRALPTGQIGVWGAATIDESIDEIDRFGLMPWDWTDNSNPGRMYTAGALFYYRGFRFVVNLDTFVPPPIDKLRQQPGWRHTQFTQPLRKVVAPAPALAIVFT